MSKYLAKVDKGPLDIPDPPKMCSVEGCQNITAVAIAMASPPESPKLRGWSWNTIAQRDNHGNVTRKIQPGYSFCHWVTRCPLCYERDAHKAKRAQLPMGKPAVSGREAKAYLDEMRAKLGRRSIRT